MKKSQKLENEKGFIILEAVIFFPIVICTITFLLYFGLFLFQEAAVNYQVQRLTTYASKNTANPGYSVFPIASGSEFEFDFSGDVPSSSEVTEYYQAYHENPGVLYRGITSIFSSSDGSDYNTLLNEMVRNGLLFRFTVTTDVEIDKNLFGTSIIAKVDYSIPAPGVMKYLGLDDDISIRSASCCYSVNPSDFIRNTDLAVDLTLFAAEKLGLSDSLERIISKAKEIINVVF